MELTAKYNVPGPRYTSYPTVPQWKSEDFNEDTWKKSLAAAFNSEEGTISLYIHLPFCESLCTYCGCTTRITKNHEVEKKYINYLLKEWKLYLQEFSDLPIIREIHLGGGTPTFFSPENLEELLFGLLNHGRIDDDFEFGFEGHPANTTQKHFETFASFGFTRVSFGVQDFNEEVQEVINRKQTLEEVKKVTDLARDFGFTSINYDLVYGLPKQTPETVRDTIEKTASLKPTRIAYYGYAHVPWIKKAQRSFEEYLPDVEARNEMYHLGKKLLKDHGFIDIGMDHFALPTDPLHEAFQKGNLHRNFMGYTTQKSKLLVGLGMSAISDCWTAFHQNEKNLKTYYEKLDQGHFPMLKGHLLTTEDLVIRKHILNLMCTFETSWSENDLSNPEKLSLNTRLLNELAADGLIVLEPQRLKVTDKGKPFIRNVCMAFDIHLQQSEHSNHFSKTV